MGRFVLSARRRWAAIGAVAVLGLLAGAGYAAVSPPVLTSNALVVLPASIHDTATQVVIAGSNPVLTAALRSVHPAVSLRTMRNSVEVKSLSPSVLSISAQGKTAAQAEGTANAVANTYVAYVTSPRTAGTVQARLLSPAANASGASLPGHLLVTGGLGVLLGLLIGAIAVIVFSRSDRRFQSGE
ncbi:MAG TPA: Wzz/FepE/Etk N-terminal domain-containing protein [Gemmatimonadales bacterium]|nr:Wzz/FepE/Etk N-terminal domain-containing protein [Gemmatimonadales bacterium]